jgi:hypothetical protein
MTLDEYREMLGYRATLRKYLEYCAFEGDYFDLRGVDLWRTSTQGTGITVVESNAAFNIIKFQGCRWKIEANSPRIILTRINIGNVSAPLYIYASEAKRLEDAISYQ